MILGRSNQTNFTTNQFDEIDYNISVEACDYVNIFVEATEELAALESAMYVADVMLEEHVLEGATNVEVLLEGVVSSMFSRLRQAVEKLWAKIKQWFANVKKYFQILFSHGKDFAKKYKADIIKAHARCKGFKYNFYNVKNMEKVGASQQEQKATETVADALGRAEQLLKTAKADESNSEIVKEHMKVTCWDGEDSQSDFIKKFREEILGESREEFEDFKEGPSVQSMLSILETGAKTLDMIAKAEKATNRSCSTLISDLKKAENTEAKAIAGDNSKTLDRSYSLAVEIVKAECNNCVAMSNTSKEMIKTLMKDSESVLKRLLSHKPKKESVELSGFEDSDSLLESALRLI